MKAIKIIMAMVLAVTGVTAKTQPNWSVNTSNFTYSMGVTAVLNISCNNLENVNNRVGAFIGSECRGVVSTTNVLDSNYVAFLLIHSDVAEGDTITFKIYDSVMDSVFETTTSLVFKNDNNIGSPSYPFMIYTNQPVTDIAFSGNVLPENELNHVVASITVDDNSLGQQHSFQLVSGEGDSDNSVFEIVNVNQIKNVVAADFETKQTYSVRVRADDGFGCGFEKSFAIDINDNNDTPDGLILSNNTIIENESAMTTIGTLTTTDVDVTDSHTYTLVDNGGTPIPDNSKVLITGAGVLQSNTSFDFEQQDSLLIRIRTTDVGGLSFENNFTIKIENKNEAPVALVLSNNTIDENKAKLSTIGVLSATDIDANESFTFQLVSTGEPVVTDNNKVIIENGVIKSNEVYNFEQQDSLLIRVKVTDLDGLSLIKDFTIKIGDVNEAPLAIGLSNNTIKENEPLSSAIGNFTTSDVDANNSFTYLLVDDGGNPVPDNARVTLATNGTLTSNEQFDFEQLDSLFIRVRTTDQGGLSFEKNVTIKIKDVNEAPSLLTLNNNTINENEPVLSVIGVLSTEDIDAVDNFTYTLVNNGGTTLPDNSKVTIDGGMLKSNEEYDFEQQDSLFIRVRSTDKGGLFIEQNFTIVIGDVNEKLESLLLDTDNIDENNQIDDVIGLFTTLDIDPLDPHTYTLVDNSGSPVPDNNLVSIGSKGELLAKSEFDFENISSITIRVRSTDPGGLFIEKGFKIKINDVNEAPIMLLLDNESIDENQGHKTLIGSFMTLDEDAGDTHTYTLVENGNETDSNENVKLSSNGVLESNKVFSYDIIPSFDITVRSTDGGGLYFDQIFTINIIDKPNPETLPVSAFISPNNDGLNDYFAIQNVAFYADYKLVVFNELGVIVYEKSANYNNDWGVTYNGKPLSQGTYYYVLKNNKNASLVYKGSFSVVN